MTINQEIVVATQLSTDGKGFKRVGIAHAPWDSTSDFLTTILPTRRHEGMLGFIRNGSNIEIWHFVGGITDDKFVKYALDSVTFVSIKNTSDDFPTIGSDNTLYVSKATWQMSIWDGSEYQIIGSPGLIDSDTIGINYLEGGQIELYTKSPVLFNGKAGTSEAIAAGVVVGATSYTNSKLAGRESEVYRSGSLISDFDQGGGVEYAIKDTDGTLNSTTINFLSPIYDGEWIKIKLV